MMTTTSSTQSGKPVLVTGAAGFIGFQLAKRLLQSGHRVVGVDNLNDYYDPMLKQARLDQLIAMDGFSFERLDLANAEATTTLFESIDPDYVVHLAAQAGVRYSIENPHAYGHSNLSGFLNVLEGCRHAKVRHLTYASSSSVYGNSPDVPYSTDQDVSAPISLYAATKKSNELMAHAYAHLYAIPTTGLRFFTVYGPWGRPDMAVFLFTEAIKHERPLNVFNHGDLKRDFTYIDDIVTAVEKVTFSPPEPDENTPPYRLYNIGNHQPVGVLALIETLERIIGKSAIKTFLPMQPGDVYATFADTESLRQDFDFQPSTPLETGLRAFVDWHDAFYGA